VATEGEHGFSEGQLFGWGEGGVCGGDEPVQLGLGKRLAEPAEEQEGAADEADLGEGDAEGEFEGEIGFGGGVAHEGALEVPASLVELGGDDDEACGGVLGEAGAEPAGAGGELGGFFAGGEEVGLLDE